MEPESNYTQIKLTPPVEIAIGLIANRFPSI